MLCLTRKCGESIVIGDNIRITITDTRRQRATVAIDAPRDVRIKRAELPDKDGPSEQTVAE